MIKSLLGQLHLPSSSSVILILLGAAFCAGGWRLFSSFRRVYGALLGGTLGLSLTGGHAEWIRLASGAMAAVAGMLLTDYVYLFGLIATGAAGTGLVAAVTLMGLRADPLLIDIACAVAFLAGGCLTAIAPSAAMMGVTSALGGLLATLGVQSLQHSTPEAEINLLYAGGAALVGLLIQVEMQRRTRATTVMSAAHDSQPLPPPPNRPSGPLNPPPR